MSGEGNRSYHIMALAVSVGLVFHGASFFNTLSSTYDVYVHIFFGEHYTRSWFDPWESRWYTGFGLISYPPMTHYLIALLSFVSGLRFGTYILCFCIVLLYVTGSYRFAKLITANDEAAGYAALVAVFLPSVVEAFHVFGQVPMMMGISWLLHSLPEIYRFIRVGGFQNFLRAISIVAVAVCSHHVTPIFGMVFFVVPLMGTAVMDGAGAEAGSYRKVGTLLFIKYVRKYIFRIVFFGFATIMVTVLAILPYWMWSKSDPITQVSIPHGSRDSFIEVFSSGLVFFILPWGFLLLLIPYYFYRLYSKRNIFLGFSFTMLIVLGTGGTTPVPKMLLGENAFNILTLERFTFWATIFAMPLAGEFLWRFTKGDIYKITISRRATSLHSLYVSILVLAIFFSAGFTTNLNYFRPLQPDPIELMPLKNFLKSDKHYKWRYLTLGFGDQMAWLSANTDALTIDGNYHSARRVPELTTRPIERLENAKYKGVDGIGTLQQFLGSPEKFHLKYIFSNDKFYDPMLYFNGWHRVKLLDNGIMVWERSDVSALPTILARKEFPKYQRVWWGTVPLLILLTAFVSNVQMRWVWFIRKNRREYFDYQNPEVMKDKFSSILYQIIKYWIVLVLILALALIAKLYWINLKQYGHERVVLSYYDALDFKRYEEAHSYLDEESGVTLDYFLLEISTTDGLLDSYGKIDRVETVVMEKEEDFARIRTTVEWVTPLNKTQKTFDHEVIRRGLKWYIKADKQNNYIPTDQFSTLSETAFLNQGRRKITTEETFHEDVLDRPVVHVRQAKLVRKDTVYYVVGLIQNLDSYPADVTVKAYLLDENDNELTSYYDQYDLTHKLMPKEVTAFKISFEEIDWRQVIYECKEVPKGFKIEVLGSVITRDLYKSVVMNEVSVEEGVVKGYLYNSGGFASTVTQIVHSYYDEDRSLRWVESSFMDRSVFPKKKSPIRFELSDPEDVEVMAEQSEGEVLVNGLDNDVIIQKYKSLDYIGVNPEITLGKNGFIRFNLNNFTGNPSPY